MAKIRDLLAEGRTFSFEFFRPKTDEASARWRRPSGARAAPPVVRLGDLRRGRHHREKTREVVEHIHHDTSLTRWPTSPAWAHPRGAGRDRARYAPRASRTCSRSAAIRSRIPTLPSATCSTASELVALVRELGDFSIGVAAHPEGHPRSPDLVGPPPPGRQARAGRLRHHAVLLRGRALRPHDGRARGAGLPGAGLPGIMPVTNVKSRAAGWPTCPGANLPPGVPRPVVRGGARPGGGAEHRGRAGHLAVSRPARPWRSRRCTSTP